MKISKLIIYAAIIGINSYAMEDNNWQFWTTDSLEYKYDNHKLKFEEELYFNDDQSLYYYHSDMGESYKIHKNINIGLNYRYINELKSDEWQQEHRPHVNIIPNYTIGDVIISDRNRLELRIRENQENIYRYRNKLNTAWNITTKTSLFISNETFLDLNGDVDLINQNRLQFGIDQVLFTKLKLSAYYMLKSDKKEYMWSESNIIGLDLKYSF